MIIDTHPVKRVWEVKNAGQKKEMKVKRTWDMAVEYILEKRGRTWDETKKLSQDKKE